MVRDAQGRYLLATADQILEATRQAIEYRMQRGASFSSAGGGQEVSALMATQIPPPMATSNSPT